jgi:hypothetical protein
MALGIMVLNMRKLRCISKRRDLPIQILEPLVQVRIIGSYGAQVGFEVLHVDDVEADDGRVETDICFCDGGPEVEGALGGSGC